MKNGWSNSDTANPDLYQCRLKIDIPIAFQVCKVAFDILHLRRPVAKQSHERSVMLD